MSSRAARGQPSSSPKGRNQQQQQHWQQQSQPRAELRQRRSTASSTSSSSTPPISPQTRSRTASFPTSGGTMVPQVTSEKEPTPSTSTEDSLQAVHVDGGGSSGAVSGRETEDDSQSDSYAGGASLNGTLPLISTNHHHPVTAMNHHYHKVAYAYDAEAMKLEALEMDDKSCCAGGGGVTAGGIAASAKPLLKRLQSSLEVPPHRGSRGNLGDDSEEQEVSTTSEDLPPPPESILAISFQVFIPFLIAGLGTVGAGLVLDTVQHWPVFTNVTELFILVPALLGLKGNLEMTLAARLSTQANLGHMDSAAEQLKMTTGNMALIQCQATVLGFLASVFAVVMGWIPEGKFSTDHALVLCASSLVTASLASLVLGGIMVGVVIASRKCHINPDNVATPIAASLGDLTTLALLSGFSSFIYIRVESERWLAPLVICIFLVLLPVWILVARRNNYTREVLSTGWTPILAAVAISSVGGLVLDKAVLRFKGIAVYQPVINGVGGNLVAVQASRISTYLHQHSRLGVLPPSDSRICLNPFAAFCGKHPHARTALVLLLMVVPGHVTFAYGISLLKAGHTSLTFTFLLVYLSAAVIQVSLLLFTAHLMVHWMWSVHTDPDNSAIPYLTAIGDLLGTSLLYLAFLFLYSVGDRDADVGD